jgi:LuxR family maltose regulon positive regulatory protein
MLLSPQPPPALWILNTLINELARNQTDFVLVLDDYHEIADQSIHESMGYLVEHMPPQMHLFIATRKDPPLPLARLRARGHMTELRAAELRFTSGEATEFFNEMMNLGLSHSQVETLKTRTEGWIAGLRMAALSIRTTNDVTAFIDSFGGGTRHIFDFLIEEVVDRQPPDMRDFLLRTSILDRLTGPLCDAVTGRDDSQEILERLERENLFLVPLDDNNRWYRYHQLFSDLLRARMVGQMPYLTGELHAKASQWFEGEGLITEAVNHAMAFKDFDRAVGLIEPIALTMIAQNKHATVLRWLSRIPDETVSGHPWLCIGGAWASLLERYYDAIQRFLQPAEVRLSEHDVEGKKSSADWRAIRGHLLTIRAILSFRNADLTSTIKLCHDALLYTPANDILLSSTLMATLGMAFIMSGDLDSSYVHFKEAVNRAKASANYYIAIASIAHMADIEAQMGHLHKAADTYRQAIQLAKEWGSGEHPPVAGYAVVGLSQVLYEWNNLDETALLLDRGLQLGEVSNEIDIMDRGLIALTLLRHPQGQKESVRQALIKARALAPASIRLDYRPIQVSSWEARIALSDGKLAEAVDWATHVEHSLPITEIPDYRSEVKYLTLVRVKIASGETQGIPDSLERLHEAMYDNKRIGSGVEVLILKALALQAQGSRDEAVVTLGRAISVAKHEGYVRIFVDEGKPMEQLLQRVAAKGVELDYVTKLLSALGEKTQLEKSSTGSSLAGVLTQREQEVLRLIAAGLSNHAAAEVLVVTEGTIKKHLNNIFDKLEVTSRTQAVARAKELDLI